MTPQKAGKRNPILGYTEDGSVVLANDHFRCSVPHRYSNGAKIFAYPTGLSVDGEDFVYRKEGTFIVDGRPVSGVMYRPAGLQN